MDAMVSAALDGIESTMAPRMAYFLDMEESLMASITFDTRSWIELPLPIQAAAAVDMTLAARPVLYLSCSLDTTAQMVCTVWSI